MGVATEFASGTLPTMLDTLLAGLAAGYAIAVPVGAIGVLIVGLAARTSFAVGAAAGLGCATADGLYAVLAVLGGAALARLIEPVATPMRWIAAAVLLGLALLTAGSAVRHHRDPTRAVTRGEALTTPGRAYAAVLGLTLLNPATIVYFAALVLGRQAGDGQGAGESVLFVAAVFAASASWQVFLAGGGTLIGRLLTGPTGRLVTALVAAAVIAVLALTLILP